MSTEADLQSSLDSIKSNLSGISTRLQTQANQIATLQAQVASGVPVTQAQLDALSVEAADLAAQSASLVTPPTA